MRNVYENQHETIYNSSNLDLECKEQTGNTEKSCEANFVFYANFSSFTEKKKYLWSLNK